ncbi:MAG: hypothetical protein ACOCYF_02610 [Bacteroidota bacterium]
MIDNRRFFNFKPDENYIKALADSGTNAIRINAFDAWTNRQAAGG